MSGCCQPGGYERLFGARQARLDAGRYRKRGLGGLPGLPQILGDQHVRVKQTKLEHRISRGQGLPANRGSGSPTTRAYSPCGCARRTAFTASSSRDRNRERSRGIIGAGLLPQKRMGEPMDVAKAVRAIAGGLLDYGTGQVLNVDGGFHLRSL